MSKETPTVAVVGLGVGVNAHIPAFTVEGFEVVALGARNQEPLDKAGDAAGVAARYTDYDKLLAHPGLDAVVIATPPPSHLELVTKALKAGKHVMLEKPFAMTTPEAAAMRDLAKSTGKTAMIAEGYRFAPARTYVKSLLADGYIGTPKQIAISFFTGPKEKPPAGPPRTHWRTGKASGGGYSGGPASTFFDSVIDWFGPVATLSGKVYEAHPGQSQANGQPADADEAMFAVFETKSGIAGSFAASVISAFGQGGRIDIFGDEGMLSISQPVLVPSPGDSVSGARFVEGKEVKKLDIPASFMIATDPRDPKIPIYLPYKPMIAAFKRGIAQGNSPSPNFEDAYQLQRITDAARESSETGRVVAI